MNGPFRVDLQPAGRSLEASPGASLQDLLFSEGVEFPCGGRGRCRGCRVRVLNGVAPAHAEDTALFSESELLAGWRLACRLRPVSNLVLELAQWEALILGDESSFEFMPRPGWGVAIDLGTTTLVAQLVDLGTGQVLAVRSGLNSQARHGADLMSRLDHASNPDGAGELTTLIRVQLGELIQGLLGDRGGLCGVVREVVLVGNSVMHHLFCGLSTAGLARHPFETTDPGPQVFDSISLGWGEWLGGAGARVVFLPCLGSFVGSDLLAGVLATRMHESIEPVALIDLGTNGEIVVGNRDRLLCASTAAGPAFEGARISMGMRASTGAVSSVVLNGDGWDCHVIGGGVPRGLCGSGLVDVVAAGLELGLIQGSGRMKSGKTMPIVGSVTLSQSDIRELQLAKGAIAAGLRILASRWGTDLDGLAAVHLAGAFGNYINRASARRIGLLPFPMERVRPAGNTALLGAKLALFRPVIEADAAFSSVRERVEHVSLNDDAAFVDTYVAEMGFPAV